MNKIVTILTISRIIIAPMIFIFVIFFQFYGLALLLFFVASVTDYFDGFLARKYMATSLLGEVLDPIADKIIIIFLLFTLSIHLNSYFIALMGALMISRDVWVNGMREMNARRSQSDRTKVTFLAKVKTSLQMFTVSSYLLALFLGNAFLLFISDFFLFLTLLVSLITGFQYTVNTISQKVDN
ncbi:MAG: CDP-diacylglycerol--glycerol-3-phosphate 3-phosphatidyltransferase [Gammaproteobacteria bacterium]|nr:CDP-diacylglycerol--glycerol-3-phosphate 3-phosphatidyltransferase [Gammaproteobacteria bacterium]|tara:strand:- start:193 stop:741 length:549 start_codon:yes stop_codon:yes gene_type:complete